MLKLISFDEGIRKGIIKEGNYVNPIECFRYDNREVLLKKEITGYESDQLFSREEKYLKWVYFKDYQGIPILVSTATYFNLGMKGRDGYKNLQKVLYQIASTYSNEEFGIFARTLKKKDVEYLIKKSFLDNIIKKDGRQIWLDDTCEPYDYSSEFFGVHKVSNVISLKDAHVLIDFSTKKPNNEWKLILANNHGRNVLDRRIVKWQN